jgi:proteasome lid subunit RPN8/RPN11
MTENNTPGKFAVVSLVKEYQPLPWSELQLETNEALKASAKPGCTPDCIYLGTDAWDIIAAHIGWGEDATYNAVELGGLLLGRAYIDEHTGLIYGIAELAIIAYSARGSMAYVKFSHQTWKEMMEEIDETTKHEQWADLQVIGWYHTHPGNLSVFMSGTDLNTQQKMFSKNWQFAIVLNPQKQTWRAFRGADARECHGEIIKQAVHGNTSLSY